MVVNQARGARVRRNQNLLIGDGSLNKEQWGGGISLSFVIFYFKFWYIWLCAYIVFVQIIVKNSPNHY